MSERSNLELGIWNLEFARMGYLVDSSSGHLLWFESVARKPAPVAGPRCEDDEGRWPASSVSWPGPLGLLARSAIEIGNLHTASRHGLEPHNLRAYWSQLNSPTTDFITVNGVAPQAGLEPATLRLTGRLWSRTLQ